MNRQLTKAVRGQVLLGDTVSTEHNLSGVRKDVWREVRAQSHPCDFKEPAGAMAVELCTNGLEGHAGKRLPVVIW